MMRASAGALTVAPTAVMMPSRITIVPFSMTGDETGTMRAFVMAYVWGMLRGETSCAVSGAAAIATAMAAMAPRRSESFIANDLLGEVARGWGVEALYRTEGTEGSLGEGRRATGVGRLG